MSDPLDVVTGAFSYTGAAIAGQLLERGRRVRTLTGHPDRRHRLRSRVETTSYRFDDLDALTASLQGATTLYNTYWIRFPYRGVTFLQAVAHSRLLFEAARRASVERIVHVSISNPSLTSSLPYFQAKALTEDDLADSGVPWAIVRPTVVFGEGDILVNNMAWLLRRFPVFAVAGDGFYRLRPVHVDDVARLCIEVGEASSGKIIEAVGPETFTFEEMVGVVRDAVGSRARLVRLPSRVVVVLSRVVGMAVRDVLLTAEELAGLMAELAVTEGPATGQVVFSEWVAAHADRLGIRYASELGRHFAGSG